MVQRPVTRHTRFNELPDLMTVVETCAYLGLGRSTVYDLLRRKELAHLRVGRRILIPRSGLEVLIVGEGGGHDAA